MTIKVSKSVFKVHALGILRTVEATGEPVIVTHRGLPSLIVQKYPGVHERSKEKLKGSVLRYDDPFGSADNDLWTASV